MRAGRADGDGLPVYKSASETFCGQAHEHRRQLAGSVAAVIPASIAPRRPGIGRCRVVCPLGSLTVAGRGCRQLRPTRVAGGRERHLGAAIGHMASKGRRRDGRYQYEVEQADDELAHAAR